MNPEPFTLASLNPTPPRRRRWLWPAVAAAVLLLLAGGAVTAGALLTANHGPTHSGGAVAVATATLAAPTASPTPTAVADPGGRAACAAAKQWNDAGMSDITEALVRQIHDSAIKSTVADLVYRGDALYDAWNKAQVEVQTQGLSGPEVQLRVMGPMFQFETACVNARYTS